MHFHSRFQTGRMLASRLAKKYTNNDCVVVALDEGGVIVGSEIAKQLHCDLVMINNGNIDLFLDSLIVDKTKVDNRNIILTSDGLGSSLKLDLALPSLRGYKKLIMAVPLASIRVVNWMHINADEIYCLSVVENYNNNRNYYDNNDVPTSDMLVKSLNIKILTRQAN